MKHKIAMPACVKLFFRGDDAPIDDQLDAIVDRIIARERGEIHVMIEDVNQALITKRFEEVQASPKLNKDEVSKWL